MRRLAIVLLLAPALFAAALEAAYESPVCAAYKFAAAAGDSYLAMPAGRPSVFSGRVSSASGSKIFASFGAGGVAAKSHYLRFATGALRGAWFDILSASGNEIVLDISASDAAKISAGDEFKIAPHNTLGSIFKDCQGLKKSDGGVPGVGCAYVFKFSYFDSENKMRIPEGVNRAPSGVFYLRKDAAGERWVLKGGDASKDYSAEIVEPDCFLIVRSPESFGLNICGEVLPAPISLNFKNASTEGRQDNFFAAPTLTELPISALDCLIENSIMAEGSLQDPAAGDCIMVFEKSNSAENPLPQKIYFYSGGWQRADGEFKNISPAAADVLDFSQALVFRISKLNPLQEKRAQITPEYAK